jgi:hypothetical protein
VEMDLAASRSSTFVNQTPVQSFLHANDGPFQVAMGANGAPGIAGIGRLDAHDGRELPPGDVHRRAEDTANRL